jgi:hypothetical protein
MPTKGKAIAPTGPIESRILLIRGCKVMLDSDLAELYQISTKRLNEQVKRNLQRFPEDFMFQLTPEEAESLRSQIATPNKRRGGRRYRPHVFTEHGAVMLASVLSSPIAVQASVQVVRAFIRLREVLAAHKDLARKLTELEQRVETHDEHITTLFDAIRQLMTPPERPRKQIGFSAVAKY